MCGSLFAPEPPEMPEPPPPAAPEPTLRVGAAEDDSSMSMNEKSGREQLKTFTTSDTGLSIPL